MTSWCLCCRIEMRPLTRPCVCCSNPDPGPPIPRKRLKAAVLGRVMVNYHRNESFIVRAAHAVQVGAESAKRQSRTRAGRMPRRGWGPGVAAACRLIRGRTWLIMKQGRLYSWNSLVWWGRGVRLFQGTQLWHLITVRISFFQARLEERLPLNIQVCPWWPC